MERALQTSFLSLHGHMGMQVTKSFEHNKESMDYNQCPCNIRDTSGVNMPKTWLLKRTMPKQLLSREVPWSYPMGSEKMGL